MRIHNESLGGLLLGVAAVQFLIAMVLGETMAPGYSMHDAAISDLGTIPNTRILFNVSLIAFGVLNLAAGYFFFLARRKPLVFAMFVLAGAGAVGAGLVPLDSPLGLHSVFALLGFLFINIEVVLVGRWNQDGLRWLALAAGLVGLVFAGLMVFVDSGVIDPSSTIGHGGVERLIVYPALIWMLLCGGRALAEVRMVIGRPARGETPS